MPGFPSTIAFCLIAAIAAAPASAWAQPPERWTIGPVIKSKNHSVGMPLHPARVGDGWYFDFPAPDERDGHVHYVTFDHGALTGKSEIILRYRIDSAPGVRFVAREFPDRKAAITLFFQRRSDDWTARGRYQFYRWYAPVSSMTEISSGVHEIVMRLDDPMWGSVLSKLAGDYPRAFRDAIADAGRVGFVFGSVGGRGHGVYATGPARFTLLNFEIR